MIPVLILLLAAAGGDVSNGRELFRSCSGCHNVDNDQRKMGPSLRTLFGKVTLHNGLHVDDRNVRDLILDGYNGMPSFRYSFRPSEIDDLMAYLHTLTGKPPQNSATPGEAIFHAYCVRCHAADLHGKFKLESIVPIEEGHKGAPAMNEWLDEPSRKALFEYLKTY